MTLAAGAMRQRMRSGAAALPQEWPGATIAQARARAQVLHESESK